jgi:hypothetical protein
MFPPVGGAGWKLGSPLFRIADVGGFAFPDGVLGGEEVDAFGVVDVAVFCDVVGADGVVDVEDDGLPSKGLGSNFVVPGMRGVRTMGVSGSAPVEVRPAL